MFSTDLISYFWRWWVSMFTGFDLPWSATTTAYIGLAVVFYLIGVLFKALVSPEK
jgi:hypothetical protein